MDGETPDEVTLPIEKLDLNYLIQEHEWGTDTTIDVANKLNEVIEYLNKTPTNMAVMEIELARLKALLADPREARRKEIGRETDAFPNRMPPLA